MNILLIGGTGFLGSGLAFHFAADSSNYVVTLGRSDLNALPGITHYNVASRGWDSIIGGLKDRKEWIVIDLAYASVPNSSFADPIKDFSENLYMVNRHLDNMEKLDLLKYLYISSGGTIYGESDVIPIPETAGNFPLSPYGITKLAAERYIYLHHCIYNLPSIIVRPSNIYGHGQVPFRGQGFIATALGLAVRKAGVQIYGDGEQTRDNLYIDDFCEGIGAIIANGVTGEIYNLGSGQGLSLNRTVQAINEVIREDGFTLQQAFLPGRPFDVRQNVLDCTKMGKLGWTAATTMTYGLQQTWQWIKTYMQTHP